MNATGQLWLTAAIVLAAAIYLIRLAIKSLSGKSGGCHSGCGGCSTSENFVELEFPVQQDDRRKTLADR